MKNPSENFRYISPKWQARLTEYIQILSNGKYKTPGVRHFTEVITLTFHDGTKLYFPNSFHLKDESAGEVAVFTEHCGYHVFPLDSTKIDVQKYSPSESGYSQETHL